MQQARLRLAPREFAEDCPILIGNEQQETGMKITQRFFFFAIVSLAYHAAVWAAAEPREVYEWMTQLEGEWVLSPLDAQEGNAANHPTVAPLLGTEQVAIEFKRIARDSTIQEDLLPGTERQMVTMYHCRDSSCTAVKATHYCAKRNQPEFLASLDSTAAQLVFECDMNTELCQSWDSHIHRITHELSDDGRHLKTVYSSYLNGEYEKDTIYHFDRK